MDAWGLDVVLTAAQKCLGTPPGLAILVFSERAMDKRRALAAVPAYYSDILRWLPIMHDPSKYFSTPCVNEIRAFAEATRIIVEEGIEERFERHDLFAGAIRAGLAALGFSFFTDPRFEASTLSVVRYPDGVEDKAFRAGLSANGVVVAGGLGPTAGRVFRMGHMGNLTSAQVRFADRGRREDPRRTGPDRRAGHGTRGRRRHPHGLTEGPARMKSKVYFIPADGREPADALAGKAKRVYLATGFNDRIAEGDFAALKIHFGEAGNTGFIKPEWLAGLIWEIRTRTKHAFLTDSNTLYVGNRSNSIDHLRLAWSHGFTPGDDRPPGHHRRRPHRPRQAGAAQRPVPDRVVEDRQRHPRRRRLRLPDPRHRARPDRPRRGHQEHRAWAAPRGPASSTSTPSPIPGSTPSSAATAASA